MSTVEHLVAGDLFLSLRRPEYMSSPEGLLSDIAWEGYRLSSSGKGATSVGLVYEGKPKGSSSRTVVATRPGRERADGLASLLRDEGVWIDSRGTGQPQVLPPALLNSVRGTKAERSGIRAAAPMTEWLARMQNAVGMTNKDNPPSYSGILEYMYQLGAGGSQATLNSTWLSALSLRVKKDPLLKRVDEFAESVLKDVLDEHQISMSPTGLPRQDGRIPDRRLVEYSPYTWFAESWDLLTSEEWITALSPRVWTDWILTSLRMVFGFGFLWESRYLDAAARAVLSEDDTDLERFLSSPPTLLPWVSSVATKSQRNVQPSIRDAARRGAAMRKVLDDWKDEEGLDSDEPLPVFTARLRQGAKEMVRKEIARSSRATKGRHNALYESIFYSLLERHSEGDAADYYALLRKATTRSFVIAPGVEWVALVASLSCGVPGGETTLGALNRNLALLGLHAPARDLIELLERAGLASGSADADQGVRVRSAF